MRFSRSLTQRFVSESIPFYICILRRLIRKRACVQLQLEGVLPPQRGRGWRPDATPRPHERRGHERHASKVKE